MESRPNEDDTGRIRDLDETWAAAAARRDLDGMMAIYAPEAQELLPGGRQRGDRRLLMNISNSDQPTS